MGARTIAGVIFDLDGVLVQTEHLGWIAWRDFLQPLGQEFSFDQYRQLIGTGETAHTIRERYGLEIPVGELISDHRRRLLSLLETDLQITPGAIETVDEVRSKGRLVAVATNSPREYTRRILELSNLAGRLDTVVTAEDVGNPKPAPDVYLAAASRLGLRSSQCLAVEDSPPGQTAAIMAGMLCAVIPNSHLVSDEFCNGSPRFPTLLAFRDALGALLQGRA
jgi:HAD superfamily hydrolase (TIGR01509 family)